MDYIQPMNERLDHAFEAARRALPDELQDELAAVVEAFVSAQEADPRARLATGEAEEIERRLDATHPVADARDYDSWLRAKVETAIREADARPGEAASLSEVRQKFGLEP